MGISWRDGFENGLTPWGAPSKDPVACTVEIVTGDAIEGVNSAHFMTVGTQQIEYAQVQHTLASASSELYARCYVKILNHTLTEGDKAYIHFFVNGANPPLVAAGVILTGGVLRWNLLSRNGTVTPAPTAQSIEVLVTNQWYLVEMYWKYGVTDGFARLSVDGIVVCELTGIDTTAYGPCLVWKTGLPTVANASASVFHWVEVLIDDGVIGEPEGLTHILTLTQTTGGTIDTIPAGKSGSANPYNHGDIAQIVATPNPPVSLSDWTITPTPTTTSRSGNILYLTMDNDYTVSAVFGGGGEPFPLWIVALVAGGFVTFGILAFTAGKHKGRRKG